jgi:proline iminopeptidase
MKTKFFIALSMLFSLVTRAQQMDSVSFNGGFLFYHVYGKGKPVIILTGGPGISYEQQEEVAIEVGKQYQAIGY